MDDSYKIIRDLGLQVFIKPLDDYQWVVSADELAEVLNKGRVLYGTLMPNLELSSMKEEKSIDSTLQGLLIDVKPLPPKTKEEAIMEVLQDFTISPSTALERIRDIIIKGDKV